MYFKNIETGQEYKYKINLINKVEINNKPATNIFFDSMENTNGGPAKKIVVEVVLMNKYLETEKATVGEYISLKGALEVKYAEWYSKNAKRKYKYLVVVVNEAQFDIYENKDDKMPKNKKITVYKNETIASDENKLKDPDKSNENSFFDDKLPF